MNTDSIYRNTDPEARPLVRAAVKADALSNMLMSKDASPFLEMSGSVIMRTVVDIIILLKNISRIILIY